MSELSVREPAEDSARNPSPPFDPTSPEFISSLIQPAMSANASVLQMNARLFHVAALASREWLDFVARRLEKDSEFTEELRRAQNPQDAVNAYSHFFQRAADDYQMEFAELLKLTSMATNGATELNMESSANMPSRRDDA